MLSKISAFIKENELVQPGQKIIAAVSGGIDSAVLCELLHQLKYEFVVAHCHFGLRAEDADTDELFVKKLAKKYNVEFYAEHFSTKAFAEEHKISIQMAARQLRYQWFETLRQKLNFDVIATAHHQNDTLETILLNLTRGTGLAGLHGILPKNGTVIRPLLCLAKDDMYEFVTENRLIWREDTSNETTKYQRNLIRHEVVPVLKQLNPNLEETIAQTTERIRGAELIMEQYLSGLKTRALRETPEAVFISIAELQTSLALPVVLSELLKPYNFNYETVKQLAENLESQSGKSYASPTHQLVKDRDELVITPLNLSAFGSLEISETDQTLDAGRFRLTLKRLPAAGYKIIKSKNVVALDAVLLSFPLKVRAWKEGDWFIPLGMKGKKKLSDFLIDQKIPLNLKPNIMVLTSGQSIVWVIGQRPDNRFKITEKTEEVLEIGVT